MSDEKPKLTRNELRARIFELIDTTPDDDPVCKVLGREFCETHKKDVIERALDYYDEATGMLPDDIYTAITSGIYHVMTRSAQRHEMTAKAEQTRISTHVLNQTPEDRALWVWTQAVQAVFPHYHARGVTATPEQAADFAARMGDAVLAEARKRFEGLF